MICPNCGAQHYIEGWVLGKHVLICEHCQLAVVKEEILVVITDKRILTALCLQHEHQLDLLKAWPDIHMLDKDRVR